MIPNWYLPIAAAVVFTMVAFMIPTPDPHPEISVAFVGNSMQYYNDFPRFMEALSQGHISQDSCLHGDATIRTLLHTGNGMYPKFMTANAVVDDAAEYIYNQMDDDATIVIHDYGACTVRQLLIGEDSRLPDQEQMENYDDYFDPEDDDNKNYINDGTNPCFEDQYYMAYLETRYAENPPHWDYIVINDNTRSPARNNTRQRSLEELEASYVPWLKETGATPVFIVTHAYWTSWRDMTGLEDVPTFTSLTYMGYREYAALLEQYLPYNQKPRIAPVAIAFLTIWEEVSHVWLRCLLCCAGTAVSVVITNAAWCAGRNGSHWIAMIYHHSHAHSFGSLCRFHRITTCGANCFILMKFMHLLSEVFFRDVLYIIHCMEECHRPRWRYEKTCRICGCTLDECNPIRIVPMPFQHDKKPCICTVLQTESAKDICQNHWLYTKMERRLTMSKRNTIGKGCKESAWLNICINVANNVMARIYACLACKGSVRHQLVWLGQEVAPRTNDNAHYKSTKQSLLLID